jgi:hypothetical protein
VSDLTVESGENDTVAVVLDGVPQQPVQYDLQLTVENGSVASFEGAIGTDGDTNATADVGDDDDATIDLSGVVPENTTRPCARSVTLATVELTGDTPGETRITVRPDRVEAGTSERLSPEVSNGTVTVLNGSSGPPNASSTATLNEPTTVQTAGTNGTQSANSTHYRVDVVVGELNSTVDANGSLTDEDGRLLRSINGTAREGKTNETGPTTLNDEMAACLDTESITVENGKASIDVTVASGCEATVSLLSYETSPDAVEGESRPVLADATTKTLAPGTHTLTVNLPGDETAETSPPSVFIALLSLSIVGIGGLALYRRCS